jgi:hypothetical protein
MLATPENIWEVPAYLPYLQPPLTDESIASAERQIGFTLPGEYVKLLRTQNGGYIRFSLPNMVHSQIAGIGPNFPSLTRSHLRAAQGEVSFSLEGLFPFDGDGHWHLCLDYRQDCTQPAVSYIDVECDHQFRIADSFLQYLERLEFKVGDQWVVTPLSDVEFLKARLTAALGIAFDPPDTFNHGYPVERARISTDSGPELLFISPNVVPRGFVRPKERRYAELKNLLRGTARRYPQLPPESYLLIASAGIRQRVLDALTSSHYTVRALRDYVQ